MKRSLLACMLATASLACNAQGKVDYTGFWKKNCEDPFGLQIKPQRGGLYAIAFCKGNGCSAPGAYRPDTRIEHDPLYEVLAPTRLKVRDTDGGFSTYVKCSNDTAPPLRLK
jgi:hypothetical protein